MGPLSQLTDEELRVQRAVRLYDPVTQTYGVISMRDYGRLYARCCAILKHCEGYIFAHDLNRIRGLMARRNVISNQELSRVSARVRELRYSGIPPIFQSEWYNRTVFRYDLPGRRTGPENTVSFESLFPSIDFLIQFGAGVLERKRAAMAASLQRSGGKGSKIPMFPASVADIL